MNKQHILMSVIALMPVTLLRSQTPTPPPANEPAVRQSAGADATSDTILATWLIVANDNEVALAKLALQSAQSKDVKQFAQQMVDDHGAFQKQLQAFAGAAKPADGSTPPKSDSGKADAKPVEASGTTAGKAAFDHQALLRDVGKQCLASATRMLADQKGAAFDHAFMQLQVGNHVMMADLLEVFGNHATTALRPTLVSGLATVRGHLDHAKMLCAQSEKVARNDPTVRGGGAGNGAGK